MSGSSAFPGLHHVDFGNDQAEDDEGGQIGASADDEDDVIAVGRIAQRYEVGQRKAHGCLEQHAADLPENKNLIKNEPQNLTL